MDHVQDFPRFRSLMLQLCETFNRPLTDALVQSYWDTLRSSRFADISRKAMVLMAKADDTSRFPRPASLRPEGDTVQITGIADPFMQRIEAGNQIAWQEFMDAKPDRAKREMRMAWLARLEVTTPHGDPAMPEIRADAAAASIEFHKRYMGRK